MVLDPAAEREHLLLLLKEAIDRGERAYDQMYDAHTPGAVNMHYADAKDAFREAISVADRAGLTAEAQVLMQRLLHVKAVYRSQFSR